MTKDQHELLLTDDGSHTLISGKYGDTYHSKHGAIQESRHVFIYAGLKFITAQTDHHQNINILEIGFGTGLNAVLSHLYIAKHPQINLSYTGLEAHPLSWKVIEHLNYPDILHSAIFQQLHQCSWDKQHIISDRFTLEKKHMLFEQLDEIDLYDLVYFDAFSPSNQPHLWGNQMIRKVARSMKENGCLVTYCAQGAFRRHLQSAGLTVERLPGPPGKREMIRAIKQ